MKFETKTALAEHLKELVNDGFLTEEWRNDLDTFNNTIAYKVYRPNFNAVKKDD